MGVPRAKKPVNAGSHWVTFCKAGNVQTYSLNIRIKHCLLELVESLQADSVSEVAGLRAIAGAQQKWETWGRGSRGTPAVTSRLKMRGQGDGFVCKVPSA